MIVLGEYSKTSRKIPVNLFFLELLIVLLFFSVAGAVILRLFAAADTEERRLAVSEHAVSEIQSVSEIYGRSGDIFDACDRVFGENWYMMSPDGVISVCMDEDMMPLLTPEAREQYGCVFITLTEVLTYGKCGKYGELIARVALMDGTGEFYRQTSSAYIPDFTYFTEVRDEG